MNKTAFAQQILNSGSLEDKLISFEHFDNDEIVSNPHVPLVPARNKIISFEKKTLHKFPSTNQLDDEKYRGILFHFFANHELLALELMALMILKFPDAPKSYTDGLIHIMKEEQSHLSLYLDRMNEYGIELGDVGLNDYFWRMISPVSSLYEFVAAMSLTFEQANIDFSAFYIKEMKKIEDDKSIKILETVYKDEIGHVKHGLDYFNQWKPKDMTDWKAYLKALNYPLTPRRAKGFFYDINARKQIGFSTEYIENLNIYSHSKGKPPDVFFFNPLVEFEISKTKISKKYKHLEVDLESLLIFAATQDDVLLCRKNISKTYLLELSELQIKLPQILSFKQLSTLKTRKCGAFIPWANFGINIETLKDIPFKTVYNEIPKLLFSKSYSQDLAVRISSKNHDEKVFNAENFSSLCHSYKDIIYFTSHSKHKNFVLKANYSNAGNRFFFINKDDLKNTDFNHSIFESNQSYVCQAWFDRVFDFSIQFEKSKDRIIKKGFVRNIIDNNGRFKGAIIGHFKNVFPDKFVQFLMFKNNNLPRIESVITNIKDTILEDSNFPDSLSFGIDMICYNDNDHMMLHPCIELNPRTTMAKLALNIQNNLYHNVVALWRILSLNEIKSLGFNRIEDFHHHMKNKHPVNFKDSKICSGYLASSDPYSANYFISFACVAASLSEIKNDYKDLLGDISFE